MNQRLSIAVLLAGCTAELSTTEQPAIATNAIATNAIATNAIATNAIATNAIATNAIATNGIFGREIQTALHDPAARVFMRYLVACALSPNDSLRWVSHDRRTREVFHGAFGLCPEWGTQAPDAACRQRVSSCILARNNAFGLVVQFSMRGNTGIDPIELADEVTPHDRLHGTNDIPASLTACPPGTTGDCNWRLARVGECEPFTEVSVAEGNRAACTGPHLGAPGTVDSKLRVCAGARACDDKEALATSNDACNSTAPEVTFRCPEHGLYAVMVGPQYDGDPDGTIGSTYIDSARCSHGVFEAGGQLDPRCSACAATVCEQRASCCSQAWDDDCISLAKHTCSYPASERRVFRWREGAFYGDLFGAWNLDPGKPEVRIHPDTYELQSSNGKGGWISDGGARARSFVGVAFPNMYACSSQNWRQQVAYFERRVCAGPDPADPSAYTRDCAATFAGECKDVCGSLDAPPVLGDRDYGACGGGTDVWAWPMTSFLAAPCDAVTGVCGTRNPFPAAD